MSIQCACARVPPPCLSMGLKYAEFLPARVVHVMHQDEHKESIIDKLYVTSELKNCLTLVSKQIKIAPNRLQNRFWERPDAPTRTEALTGNSWPRFWAPFRVPRGVHWKPNWLQNWTWKRYTKSIRFGPLKKQLRKLICVSFSRPWKRDVIEKNNNNQTRRETKIT